MVAVMTAAAVTEITTGRGGNGNGNGNDGKATAPVAATATAMVVMVTATVAVAVAAMATSMAWMVTAMAVVRAMATVMAAVTTINSKKAAMAAAEELDDGWDERQLCSVFCVIPISSHHHCKGEVSESRCIPGLLSLLLSLIRRHCCWRCFCLFLLPSPLPSLSLLPSPLPPPSFLLLDLLVDCCMAHRHHCRRY
jgi:hypothetical protein